jgi:hypothetical protein
MRLGWRRAGNLRVVRATNPQGLRGTASAAFRLIMDRCTGRELYPFGRSSGQGRPTSQPGVVLERDPRPARMAAVAAAAAASDARLRLVEDERYFRWRFGNPRSIYRFLWSYDGRDPNGFAVIRAPRRPTSRKAAVVALRATSDPVSRALISAALGLDGITYWSIWAGTLGTPMRSFLRESGFRSMDAPDPKGRVTGQNLLVRSLRDGSRDEPWTLGDRDLASIDSWDLSMLASDAF